MNDKFTLGEIAIYHGPEEHDFNGNEVTIIGALQERVYLEYLSGETRTGLRYMIARADGKLNHLGHNLWTAPASWLRKRKPPREDLQLTSWDRVPGWEQIKGQDFKVS